MKYNEPPKVPRPKKGEQGYDKNGPDAPQKESGDENLAESSPTDSRLDEKVIVNEQRSDKIVNGAPQTSANTSERSASDEEIVDPL